MSNTKEKDFFIGELKKSGIEFVNYDIEHTERHFSGSKTIGSKALPDMGEEEKASIIGKLELEYLLRSSKNLQEGKEVGREEIIIDLGKNVGTNALADLSAVREDKILNLVRDAGTPYQSEMKVVIVQPEDMPQTTKFTGIYGKFGPTAQAGNYTMFPGDDPGKPMPNPERQTPEQLKECTDYWKTHGFYATPEEVEYTLGEMGKHLETNPELQKMTIAARKALLTHGQDVENGSYKSPVPKPKSQEINPIVKEISDRGRI